MFVTQAHSFSQQSRLAITLAWIAGYTNILTILTCGTVTSHVSGTVSNLGRDVVQGKSELLLFTSFLLVTFIGGAMTSALCTESGRRRGWESIYVLPMAVQAVLLAAFAIGLEWNSFRPIESGLRLYVLTGLASMAMGLQNATITRISSGVVRTTHMTGVFTDLGLETVQFLFWLRDRKRDSPPLAPKALVHSMRVHPTARRLALLASVVGSFALGSGLGAAAFGSIPRFAMFPPVMFLLWIVFQDIRLPICEVEESDSIGSGRGLDLPSSMAVFHLRKKKGRREAVHRFPNLLAWSERLPDTTAVVILDLEYASRIDGNVALELRALMQRFQAAHRHLVISGVSGAMYGELRRAGAGDVLDPTNLCPDLELAIARGLTLLEHQAAK